MLKEICEEPTAVANAVAPRINEKGLPDFSSDGIDEKMWKDTDCVSVISCGSATHGDLSDGTLSKNFRAFRRLFPLPEYRYDPPATFGKTLAVPISQSGETADTLAGLRLAKQNGEKTLAIVNAVGSAVAREADGVIYQNGVPKSLSLPQKGMPRRLAACPCRR